MRVWVSWALLMFLLAACTSAGDDSSEFASLDGSSSNASQSVDVADVDQPQQRITERVILRSASLTLVVDDPRASLDTITQMATEQGGWVVNSTARTDGDATVSVQIRVPAEDLDATLAMIKLQATEIVSEVISGQDVTQDYTDLSSQLNNLEAAETQLQSIMDIAEDTQSVLSIYNELVRIRGEIETIRGRINFFDESAAFASISVQLRSEGDLSFGDEDWNPDNTVESAVALLGGLLRFFVDAAIFLVIVGIPLVIILGIPFGLYRRFMRSLSSPDPTVSAVDGEE